MIWSSLGNKKLMYTWYTIGGRVSAVCRIGENELMPQKLRGFLLVRDCIYTVRAINGIG